MRRVRVLPVVLARRPLGGLHDLERPAAGRRARGAAGWRAESRGLAPAGHYVEPAVSPDGGASSSAAPVAAGCARRCTAASRGFTLSRSRVARPGCWCARAGSRTSAPSRGRTRARGRRDDDERQARLRSIALDGTERGPTRPAPTPRACVSARTDVAGVQRGVPGVRDPLPRTGKPIAIAPGRQGAAAGAREPRRGRVSALVRQLDAVLVAGARALRALAARRVRVSGRGARDAAAAGRARPRYRLLGGVGAARGNARVGRRAAGDHARRRGHRARHGGHRARPHRRRGRRRAGHRAGRRARTRRAGRDHRAGAGRRARPRR